MGGVLVMQKLLIVFCFTILWVYSNAFAASQNSAVNPQLKFIGARLQALGETNPTLLGEISGVFINPAVIGTVNMPNLSLTNESLLGMVHYSNIVGTFPYKDMVMGLAYGNQNMSGIPQNIRENGRIRSINYFSSGFRYYQGTVSKLFYDSPVFNEISIGINGKFYDQYLDTDNRYIGGLDIGAIGTLQLEEGFLGNLTVGGSLINVLSMALGGDKLTYSSHLPFNLVLGGRLDLFKDSLSVFMQTGIEGLNFSTEYHLPGNLDLRAGTNFKNIHLGTGITLENISGVDYKDYSLRVDYSYSHFLDPSHAFYGDQTHAVSISFLGETRLFQPKILYPKKGFITKENYSEISGVAEPNIKILIYNNNELIKTIKTDSYGNYKTDKLPLKEGRNRLYVKAYSIDKDLSIRSKPIIITSDNSPPNLNVSVLPEGENLVVNVYSKEKLDIVSGSYQSEKLGFVEVNSKNWRSKIPMPISIKNNAFAPSELSKILVIATDPAGNETDLVQVPFFLKVTQPLDKTVVYKDVLNVSGKTSAMVIDLKINNGPVVIDKDNNFSEPFELAFGQNLIRLKAITLNGEVLNYLIRVLRLATFPDVKDVKGQKEIEYLATLGVLMGEPDGLFYPENPLTRIQLAKIIARVNKLNLNSIITDPIKDVAITDSGAPFVQAVIENGYMAIFPDGTFRPSYPMTIGQTMSILSVAGITSDQDVVESPKVMSRRHFALLLAYSPVIQNLFNELINW